MSRRVLAGLGAVTVVGALAANVEGCRSNPAVTFDIALPSALSSQAAWIEIGVFKSTCTALAPTLSGGVPPDGATTRVAFKFMDAAPALGDLPKAQYAFAVVARDQNCTVLATGCEDVDVSDERNVAIQLVPTTNGGGVCAAGAVCQDARCIPGSDNSDPSVGAGCSLELLGAGPLGDPLTPQGDFVSAPAVSATAGGFLIAYREFNQYDGTARLSTVLIDNGGGSQAASARTLLSCTGVDESDAVGMAFSSSNSGLIAMSRPSCPPQPAGVDLLVVDSTGTISTSGFEGKGDASRSFSNAHAVAWNSTLHEFMVAFSQSRADQVAIAPSAHFDQHPPYAFGGGDGRTNAWVASTDSVVAFLSAGSGSGTVQPDMDAGGDPEAGDDDAGDPALDADPPPPPPVEAGAPSGTTLRLQVLGAKDDLATLPSATIAEFNGTWGSLAALGGRVITASDGNSSSRPVLWRVFEGGGKTAIQSDGFTTDGLGKVIYADVAFNQNRLFFAVERSLLPNASSISLVECDNATTSPTCTKKVYLPKDPRIPAMANVRDGRVAVAASDTRVAVVWTTARNLTDKDPVGGYALFACTSP